MIPTAAEHCLYNVLILETDSRQAAGLLEELALRGIRGTIVVNPRQADGYLEKLRWSLVFVSEEVFSNFVETISLLTRRFPEVPVVLVGSQDCSRKALDAVRCGFADYLPRPLDKTAIASLLNRYVPNHPVDIAGMICAERYWRK